MKLYAAGAEEPDYTQVVTALGYPYRLVSFLKLSKYSEDRINTVLDHTRHGEWIMDSGLFSFLFGTKSGASSDAPKTYDDFYRYASNYVETLLEWGWSHPIVECDTQDIIGIDATYKLREAVFEQCGLDVIYVWHGSDDIKGLHEMGTRYEHMALGALGLGRALGNRVRAGLLRALRELRNNGDPKVHLLGNTRTDCMSLPADSCDSTSWLASARYGHGYVYEGGKLTTAHVRSPKWAAWHKSVMAAYPEEFDKIAQIYPNDDYTTRRLQIVAACLVSFWRMMEKIDGEAHTTATPA